MARYDDAGLRNQAIEALGAEPDPSGVADLIFEKGSIVVIGDPNDMKAGFKRLKKMDGFRWALINKEDLFAENTLSLGSKAGLMDASGAVLKAAALPRKSM